MCSLSIVDPQGTAQATRSRSTVHDSQSLMNLQTRRTSRTECQIFQREKKIKLLN